MSGKRGQVARPARRRSLQGRLAWLVLSLLVSVWAVVALVVWFDAHHEVEEILDSHLAQAAALVVGQVRQDHHVRGGRIDMPELHRYAYKTVIQVLRGDTVLLRSANAPVQPLHPGGSGPVLEDDGAGLRTVRLDGTDWRVFEVRDGVLGLTVLVGEASRARRSILLAVLRSTLWPMCLALPLLVLAVWWVMGRGLAPMHRLRRTLAERRPDALDPVPVGDALAEMVPVIEALNALFGRIETLLAGERRFTADAAHELRTPIAGIQAHAQVALRESDEALRNHALRNTLDGCDRAARLVNQLLNLARLNANAQTRGHALDLRVLAHGVLAELAPGALARHQSLALRPGPACPLQGDDTLLAVLLHNLVDNALRHGPPGTQVQVSVGPAVQDGSGLDQTVLLQVEDSGPGLAEDELQRLGERFFRPPGSPGSGSSLGLAIVRRIAAAHRLSVDIGRSPALGGLRVQLCAPRSASAPTPPGKNL